jgi:hypothetical protein
MFVNTKSYFLEDLVLKFLLKVARSPKQKRPNLEISSFKAGHIFKIKAKNSKKYAKIYHQLWKFLKCCMF